MENNEQKRNSEENMLSDWKINFPKSKEDIWAKMEGQLSEATHEKQGIIRMNWVRISVAAAAVILLASGLFMRFYTVNIQTQAGEFLTHTLPDGSIVHLNAESEIAYAPYWWNFKRELSLEGEAFFDVAKGEKFAVTSENAKTEVLGTSFNIYARNQEYQVFCVTGKVKVSNAAEQAIVLKPGDLASLNDQNMPEKETPINSDAHLAWRSNTFIFDTTPLNQVFEDLERHYNIEIDRSRTSVSDFYYTGLFYRDIGPDKALDIICLTFGLEFEKADANRYIVQ